MFVPGQTFQPSLMTGKAVANLSGAPCRWSPLG